MKHCDTIKLKIYLKNKRKPLIFMLSSEKKINNIVESLLTSDFVTIGPITFAKSEFLYFEQA